MKRFATVMLLCAFLAPRADAYTLFLNRYGNPRHWNFTSPYPAVSTNVLNRQTHAVRYYLASDGYSGTNAAAELAAVRAAFAEWQSVPGTCVKFEDAGTIAPPVDVNTSDNTNVIYWARTNVWVNKGRDNISGSLAVTYLSYTTNTHEILQGDIVFNGRERRWFADPSSATNTGTYIGSVALHEIGHFLGLAHSTVGGAAMFFRGEPGVNLQSRLSSDDIAGLRALYSVSPDLDGSVRGQMTRAGHPVLGAAVYAEDVHGNIAASALSWTNGAYCLNGLPPGKYFIRAAPLDPISAGRLCDGRDIITRDAGAAENVYNFAETRFLSSTNMPAAVTAGGTNQLDIPVAGVAPPFRITQIRKPTAKPDYFSMGPLPVSLRAGQSNFVVGVASPDLPTNDVALAVTGDGIVCGPASSSTFAHPFLHVISATISVAPDATPGLRSFEVRQGTNTAWANGFLEIQPRGSR